MSHKVPWKSNAFTWQPGTVVDIADFVPLTNNGKRVVVDRFLLRVTGTITVGTGVWDGRDVWRLFSLITVEKRDGKLRWNLSGTKSRAMSIHLHGIQRHTEHANVAVGAGQAIDLTAIIPMIKPFRARPTEFSLGADTFKKVTLSFNTLGAAQTGTAVLSANALTVYILADWHEEDYVEVKCDDIVRSVDFTSTTQAKLQLQGLLHDALIIRDDGTAGGGNAITAITDVRCEDLSTPLLTRSDLLWDYTIKRQLAPSNSSTVGAERYHDPARDGLVLPFITADDMDAPWDGKFVDAAKIDIGTGAANLSMLTCETIPKSQADLNQLAQRHGFSAGDLSVVTKSGTQPLSATPLNPTQKKFGSWRAPIKNKAN